MTHQVRKKGKPKKRAQEIHATRRALERYGVKLTRQDLEIMINLIQQNSENVKFIEKDSHRVTIWEIRYLDHIFKACYDKNSKMICTFLPPEF